MTQIQQKHTNATSNKLLTIATTSTKLTQPTKTRTYELSPTFTEERRNAVYTKEQTKGRKIIKKHQPLAKAHVYRPMCHLG